MSTPRWVLPPLRGEAVAVSEGTDALHREDRDLNGGGVDRNRGGCGGQSERRCSGFVDLAGDRQAVSRLELHHRRARAGTEVTVDAAAHGDPGSDQR